MKSIIENISYVLPPQFSRRLQQVREHDTFLVHWHPPVTCPNFFLTHPHLIRTEPNIFIVGRQEYSEGVEGWKTLRPTFGDRCVTSTVGFLVNTEKMTAFYKD